MVEHARQMDTSWESKTKVANRVSVMDRRYKEKQGKSQNAGYGQEFK